MPRILIIDDDDAVRRATTIMLESRGFEVVAVDGGQAGLDAVRAGAFDAVIVDLFMPGMDGRDTIRALRQHAPRMPIIAASGAMAPALPGAAETPADATDVGADFNLHKPFRPRQLLDAVRQLLDGDAPVARRSHG